MFKLTIFDLFIDIRTLILILIKNTSNLNLK